MFVKLFMIYLIWIRNKLKGVYYHILFEKNIFFLHICESHLRFKWFIEIDIFFLTYYYAF